jgi:hypothetical protein
VQPVECLQLKELIAFTVMFCLTTGGNADHKIVTINEWGLEVGVDIGQEV